MASAESGSYLCFNAFLRVIVRIHFTRAMLGNMNSLVWDEVVIYERVS